MSAKLTFISAGAGSGKTHTLTEILHKELSSGTVRPAGVIATTFTRKAATELRERVRGYLLDQGAHGMANAMGQARIGTVNAVCGELLRRFAFEAGLPTEQTVLEEEQAKVLLRHAIDAVQESEDAVELLRLVDRLGIQEWEKQFAFLVSQVRSNAIDPDALPAFARENAEDLLKHLPRATTDDLDDRLIASIDAATPALSAAAAATKKTADYLELAQKIRRGIQHGDAAWSDWVKISKMEPAAALRSVAQDIADNAGRAAEHPQLHADISAYLERLFVLCADVLRVYREIKRERGVLDFTDQERLLLQVLDDPTVAETLAEELDLLMVDEFQDTSPIQLALFLKLAGFAKRVYWVGDVKQAIYGFRGSDTALMEAIVRELGALGGTKQILDRSWRSRPPLVALVNALFVPAFAPALDPSEIALIPQRDEPLEGQPFANWMLQGKNKGEIAAALAGGIRTLIESGYLIFDKPANTIRPVRYGDIAILRRQNDDVTATALQLRQVGIPATTAQPGLLATPEAVLALACLRRLNDPGDTIATAEILSLAECMEPEIWIMDRLQHLAAGGNKSTWREQGETAHPLLARIAELRKQLPLLSPSEALQTVTTDCEVPSRVLRWTGNPEVARVRLANLDTLVAMARQYEDLCHGAQHAASVSGLILWLKEQAAEEQDSLAQPGIDAVQIMTHHAAKGLEWPVVILMDLQGEVKDRLWGISAISRKEIVATDPLADRFIRYWPWPFGKQDRVPLKDEISQSPVAAAFHAEAVKEAKRLLYVSMTRARDLLIIARPEKKHIGPWLETLDAPWLLPEEGKNELAPPSGERIPARRISLAPATDAVSAGPSQPVFWFPDPEGRTERLSLIFNPSAAISPPVTIAETADIGIRVDVANGADWATLGTAVHACAALAFADTAVPIEVRDIETILNGYGMTQHIAAAAVHAQILAFRDWIQKRWTNVAAHPEIPVESVLANGQLLNGRIDLLLDVGDGWILIDHKTSPKGRSEWASLADDHGGQLAAYAAAIQAASSRPVLEQWLFLPVAAGAIRIVAKAPMQ